MISLFCAFVQAITVNTFIIQTIVTYFATEKKTF